MVDGIVIAMEWRLDLEFANRVAEAINRTEQDTSRPIRIISGWRSHREQQALIDQGVGAPLDVSNHTSCPSTAVDVTLGPFPTLDQKRLLGINAAMFGLRWGGGSPIDGNGIPTDWNHLDRGPRVKNGGCVSRT